MDSLDTNPQLTAEFVKFLNAQLQDCGDQLQRLNESVYHAMQLTGIILQLPGECFPQADPSRKRTATWRHLWPYGRSDHF
ncbi:hypothetical protein VTO73DRAFT_2082 [Trametes versicolor]